MDEQKQQETNQVYEKPEITDYGTLVDLTRAGHHMNADSPFGNDDTAFAPHSPS
ncbi:MAG TPA: lasso RiPP family leader peptide-containing protein [Solirubrobacteraceae bacterium]|jgi:hypothetical protein|nr:lasso RiPP family leader peptide-containing protein [Solirubrobacteraceae bacterium]